LQNIELKKSALDDLHLPIKVTRGHVGKIIINIPWTSLNTNPVRLRIDDILLQAVPLDISSMSSEELKEHLLFGKQKKLNEIEESILNKNNNTDNIEEKSIGMMNKLNHKLEISN
jgi:vacuolar protein sorting-associated protein 13A/C